LTGAAEAGGCGRDREEEEEEEGEDREGVFLRFKRKIRKMRIMPIVLVARKSCFLWDTIELKVRPLIHLLKPSATDVRDVLEGGERGTAICVADDLLSSLDLAKLFPPNVSVSRSPLVPSSSLIRGS